MCEYYYDEDRAVAYKIYPVTASIVKDDAKGEAILVHTNVKLTNFKKEKVRRTLSHVYPVGQYDLDSAKKEFTDTLLAKLLTDTRQISEDEYDQIKARVEA